MLRKIEEAVRIFAKARLNSRAAVYVLDSHIDFYIAVAYK